MEYFKKEKAITLIALVITIIVLLILAGVAITALSGNENVMNKAQEARISSDIANDKDRLAMIYNSSVLANTLVGQTDLITTLVEELQKDSGIEIIDSSGDCCIVKVKSTDNMYVMDTNCNIELISNPEQINDCVAVSNTILYPTLQLAIDSVGTGNEYTEITLLKNVSENPSVKANQSISLNLGKHTLSAANDGAILLTTKGNLKIKNGKIQSGHFAINNYSKLELNENLEINDTSTQKAAVYNQKAGVISINNAKVNATDNYAITNYGQININNNSSINSTNSCGINNYGTISTEGNPSIKNGSNKLAAIVNHTNSTLNFNGGEIQGNNYYSIHNEGIANVGGSTLITNCMNYTIMNKKTLNVKDNAQIIGDGEEYSTICNEAQAEIYAVGGTIHSENSNSINNYGYVSVNGNAKLTSNHYDIATISNKEGATVEVYGGEVSANGYTPINNYSGGTVTISGGLVQTTSSTARNVILNRGTCNITGGTIKGVSTNVATINNSSIMNISNGDISAQEAGAMALYNTGTLKITGGKFTSKRYAICSELGGTVECSGAEINGPIKGFQVSN